MKTVKNCIGVNEIGLISKLVAEPCETVWKKLRDLGVESIEVCAIPYHNEKIQAYVEEAAKKYPIGMPPCLSKGNDIYDFVGGILSSGLHVHSCHLLLCEAYPELVAESIDYMKAVAEKTAIRQFVVSCMFDSASKTEQFLSHIQKAAASLRADDINLCYHNHHMDCLPLENGKTAMEMVLDRCPDCMIQLDVGWAWYGGMDSVKFMEQYGSRIVSVHLKDLTTDARERTDDSRFTAIGAGAVPIRTAVEHLHLCNIKPGFLITDQDASIRDMYDEIAFGIEFIKKI